MNAPWNRTQDSGALGHYLWRVHHKVSVDGLDMSPVIKDPAVQTGGRHARGHTGRWLQGSLIVMMWALPSDMGANPFCHLCDLQQVA